LGVIVLILVVLVALGVVRGRWNPPVEMPSRDVKGPLQLVLETKKGAPFGHSPSTRWRTHHREALARGDFTEKECQDCHDPEKYCNQCHGYVGVKRIKPIPKPAQVARNGVPKVR
jgi:hypothetical protein